MASNPALAEIFRLLQSGNAAGALERCRALLAEHPRQARAYLAAGLALRALGQLEESHAALQAALRLDPDDYAAAYELGITLDGLGRREEARTSFDRAVQLRPAFAPAHAALGLVAFAGGDWPRAVASFEQAARLDPADPSVATNLGLARAESGDFAAAEATLREALSRFPQFPPLKHALGWTLHKARRTAEGVEYLREAVDMQGEARYRVDLGKALADLRRHDEAMAQYEAAAAAAPHEKVVLVPYGRYCVARGDFARAANLFRAAAQLDPRDIELPMYLAQVELARGRWREGWQAYARREQRLRHEHEAEASGRPYRVPSRSEVTGQHVLLVGEQGLGDEIFFMRFVPALRALGAKASYVGEARLAPLLQRSGLFESVHAFGDDIPPDAVEILSGDLPSLLESEGTPASIAIAPEPARIAAMKARLERLGPRPWIGVTWRAGTPHEVVAHALHKQAPIPGLFAALPREGTVLSLQRDGHFDELESASHALGRPLFDLSNANDDLEDALAVVSLLDRHVGVSNTNMHLAAAAGATADVLVPFPPEWRWGLEGDSPWFPGFRVYRQQPDGDWSRAYAALASAAAGSRSRG